MQLSSLSSLFFILAIAVSFRCIAAGPGKFDDLCSPIVEKHPDIRKVFCQAALVSASNSVGSSTDPNQLAGALAKIATSNVEATKEMLEEHVELHEDDEDTQERYIECIKIYDLAITHMEEADGEISQQQFEKAIAHLKLSVNGGEKCKKIFEDSHHVCPHGADDKNYSRLVNIAVHLLLGSM